MTYQALSWYAQNSVRRYPLSDAASGETDDGRSLPNDILVDCHLRFPLAIGQYAFLGSVHVSDKLVSLVLLAAMRPAIESDCAIYPDEASFMPLAAISLPRSQLVEARQVAVSPLYPGVGGWVVFGACQTNFQGRFSTTPQSMLLPRTARPYSPLPVTEAGKLRVVPQLTGLVLLKAGSDMTLTRQTLSIDGENRSAIVLALKDQPGRNVLADYTGP